MNASGPGDHSRTLTLRRASYVHVSDLTSAYNIDHGLLEQELNRINSDSRTEIPEPRATDSVSQVDPTTVAADLDVSATTQKRLQPPRGGFNLCVLVGNVNIVVDKRRVDGSRVRLAEVEIGDETGTVSLRARDEQIDVLEDVSSRAGAVVLRNCTLELFQRRHIRLAITKWGKLSIYPDNIASTPPPPSKMNLERNFSRIDLTIVASELVDTQLDAYPNKQYRFPSEGNETAGRQASMKDSGQSSSKQNNQSRRNSRDRRHSRGKAGSVGNRSHYNLTENERRMLQPNQLNYGGMHGYSRYPVSEGYGLSPYPYHLGGQHEVVSPVAAQPYVFQHPYELQQGHYQSTFAPTQDQNVHAPARFILDPNNRGAGLVPIGATPEPNSNLRREMTSPPAPTSGPARMMQRRPVSPEGVHGSPMPMNPDAMAFAPASYMPQPYFPTYHLPLHHSLSVPTFGQVPQYVQPSETSALSRTQTPPEQAPSPKVQSGTLLVSNAQQDTQVVPDGNEVSDRSAS